MKAVVMAGGEGSRLRPLTSNRPKPMAPICNEPIMEHIVGLLARHGFVDIVATVYYLADEIQSHFGDGADFGVHLTYSVETSALGTAGSVKRAQHLLDGEPLIIISGDALTDCDLQKALDFHREKRALATIVLHRVEKPLDFGVVVTAADGRIERFVEKPGWSEVISDTINTGIYILEPQVLDLMKDGVAYDWSADVFPKMLEEGMPIYGFVMDGYWADIGSLPQYLAAQEDVLTGKVGIPMQHEPMGEHIAIGPNCVIDETVTLIPPLCIGRNCKIKANATIGPNAVIGDNAFIEERATVERSVLWDNVYIGPNAGLHAATVCSRATIKKDSTIGEDAVIGDRCLVDVGCTIRPHVKIWPDKVIERGSIVTMSLVWGSRWRRSLFRELGVAGLSNVEITPDFACRIGSAFGSLFPPGSSIVTSRDSTRSSRMIKRAIISALLSVGCNVIDLRSSALPVVRHTIKTSGAVAAVNVRKLPGNTRVTLIEMFDENGGYISREMERRVESVFFREDYSRTDPDDLGQIEFAGRALEEYLDEFFRLIPKVVDGRRLRIVCDYGYSAMANILPSMLARLGIESLALSSFNDAKLAPRTDEQIDKHVQNLAHILSTLGYDMGVLITQDGERLTVVDEKGLPLRGNQLLAAMGTLLARAEPGVGIGLSITAPTLLEDELVKLGAVVLRTKADVRSMSSAGQRMRLRMVGDDRGGFVFPDLHLGFDAAFSLVTLLNLLTEQNITIGQAAAQIPVNRLANHQVRVPWESKGSVMRRLAEGAEHAARVETLDGLKIFEPDGWVLILPDSLEPLLHIYAESPDEDRSARLAAEYVRRIEELIEADEVAV